MSVLGMTLQNKPTRAALKAVIKDANDSRKDVFLKIWE